MRWVSRRAAGQRRGRNLQPDQFGQLLDLFAEKGIATLVAAQRKAVG